MIEVYTGRLGSGKTYAAVRRTIEYLSSGGTVCTNIALKWEVLAATCKARYGVEVVESQVVVLEEAQIGEFHKHTPAGSPESPVLVIIDEAQIYLNARDWASASRELLSFLCQSRKVHTDVIFITQSEFNIDKQILRLVQYIWRFRNMENWLLFGRKLSWCHVFRAVQFDYDGKTELSAHWVPKESWVYESYNTFQLLRTFERSGAVKKVELKKVKKGDFRYLAYVS